LDSGDPGPVDWLTKAVSNTCERVTDWQHRRSTFKEFEARQETVDHGGRAKGAGGIVDENGFTFD
jgi:hypothetical protein